MIPMADNLNHSHGTCVNEVINIDYHIMYQPANKSVPKVYFTKEKFMNNYQTAFTEEQVEKSPVNILGGRFSKENYQKNITKYSLETLKKEA
jgi:hypothetical protein